MRAISASYVPKSYADLLRCVQHTLFAGQREIDEAWVRTYHETGRLIVTHILLNRRADYGAHVVKRLVRDTDASERRLYECAQFYRSFPILRLVAELGWNRCRLLCQVSDEKARLELALAAKKHDWPTLEITRRVRAFNSTHGRSAADDHGYGTHGDAVVATAPDLLVPRRGTPGLHPIVDRGDGPVVDLGFKLYRALNGATGEGAARLRPYTVGDIVRVSDDGVRRVDDAARAELFTYAATIRRVVDGDTLLVALDVGPGIALEKLLRLRGVDCPETGTAAGRAAKRFVEECVAVGDAVILSTTKPDKYDRSLADVFVPTPRSVTHGQPSALNARPGASRGGEIFLNNALLEHGHAVRYDGGPKDE